MTYQSLFCLWYHSCDGLETGWVLPTDDGTLLAMFSYATEQLFPHCYHMLLLKKSGCYPPTDNMSIFCLRCSALAGSRKLRELLEIWYKNTSSCRRHPAAFSGYKCLWLFVSMNTVSLWSKMSCLSYSTDVTFLYPLLKTVILQKSAALSNPAWPC